MIIIITKRKLIQRLDDIIEAVHEHSEFDVEVCGYHDYDIVPSIPDTDKPKLLQALTKILKGR